jgi:tetratricopeptide (TPR) repeat protein
MKKRTWLDALENASLVGLGVGSVASLLLKELIYTTTPLSLLVAFGLVNRRRFEQLSERKHSVSLAELDQKLTKRVEGIQHQIQSLPAPETLQGLKKAFLKKDREVAAALYGEIEAVQQEFQQRIVALEEKSIEPLRQDLALLSSQQLQFSNELKKLSGYTDQLSESTRLDQAEAVVEELRAEISLIHNNIEGLAHPTQTHLVTFEQEIARLDRQLSSLSPYLDLSSIRQEISELVRIVGDLVPKRELVSLVSEVREIYQAQEALKQAVSVLQEHQNWGEGQAGFPTQEFNAIVSGQLEMILGHGKDLNLSQMAKVDTAIYPELQGMAAEYLSNLRSQLASIQEFTDHLARQQQVLKDQIKQLPKTLDVMTLQCQVQELSKRLPATENKTESFQGRIQDILQQELQYINEQLQSLPATPNYELLFDLNGEQAKDETGVLAGSQTVLEEALEQTQQRLILIWPWSDQCSLDETLMQKFNRFLQQGRRLDIGWCHLADRQEERLLNKLRRGWKLEHGPQEPLRETLRKLLDLKKTYPDNFQFKILGTSENFLVSDSAFAVLGIADALQTQTAFSELQLKLKTRDPEVIERLTYHFDHPALDPDDITAYWNRAVTRHDLGDKAGAIADFSHILDINPHDAMTYNYRGVSYYDLGDVDAAIADFNSSIQLSPYQIAAHCNRAFLRLEKGDAAGAISDYGAAIQASPDAAIAYFYRGTVWQKLERYQEAMADFNDAIRYKPDAAVAFYHRGLIGQKLGDCEGAINDLEQAAILFTFQGSHTNAEKAKTIQAKIQRIAAKQAKAASVSSPLEMPVESQESSFGKQQGETSNPFAALGLPDLYAGLQNGDTTGAEPAVTAKQPVTPEAQVAVPTNGHSMAEYSKAGNGNGAAKAESSEFETLINLFLNSYTPVDRD